jgi:serine protease Do
MKSLRLPFLLVLCAFAFACSKAEPIDETHEGALEDSDSVLEDDGSFYDHYSFRAQEGWQIEVSMESDEFDTYLLLVKGSEATMSAEDLVQQNDDVGGGNTNSAISVAAPASGTYTVIANSFTAGETGAYTLRITTTDGAASADEGESAE